MVVKKNRVHGNIEDDKHDKNEDVIEENNNLHLARLLFLHRQVGWSKYLENRTLATTASMGVINGIDRPLLTIDPEPETIQLVNKTKFIKLILKITTST